MAFTPDRKSKIERYIDAAFHGKLTLLKQLASELDNGGGLKRTFETVTDHNGTNALHFAANGGQNDVCGYLVSEVKVDLSLKDVINGSTALHHAVEAGRLFTVDYLIDIGADVELGDQDGYTALHLATANGNLEIMELLISRGADIESISKSDTPLHVAACGGKAEALKLLLDNKADPNSIGPNGITPLLLSITAKSLQCVKLLIKAGADPNLVAGGVIPLVLASNMQQPILVKYLEKHGAVLDLCGYAAELGVGTPCCGSSEQCKEKGRCAFGKENYRQAVAWFTKGIASDPSDATLFSNRSLCWIRLSKPDKALDDALECVKLNPTWHKAHYREGAAYKLLGSMDFHFALNYEKAAEAFEKALQLKPGNDEILKELDEVQEMILGVI